ncbi:bifunctional methylenetetrahydrofolate dehydrogenase/methenyltetrahydrofolate cyclohydrolase FolD [SAR202 cluster bacterium AC-409-J13_OGT_754m]|nr:bifunctional methylenetetrahydrofolate dehydrogenase/methenyltetrahydrofolate cyclohydrolase FolD [SAR202 cluster bacterium AC-409-J13_OGT_754m]
MTILLDGKATSQVIREEIAASVKDLVTNTGITPGLAAVLVGDDPASAVYVRNKSRACGEVGIFAETFRLSADSTQHELEELIDSLNSNDKFHGVLIQLPLPQHMDEIKVIARLDPNKDVDCMHPLNIGLLMQGRSDFIPGTPGGIQQLLVRNGYSTNGKHVVICGRSNIVGKPLAILMLQKTLDANATVTVCHTGTSDLPSITKKADILVAAIGKPKAIRADMVRDGAIVVDVGINRIDDASKRRGYRLVGDVDFDGVVGKVAAITPVPGGVGPMTIAMLLVNTITAAKKRLG